MRGVAVLLAAAAAWMLVGAPIPWRPRPSLPTLDMGAAGLAAGTALVAGLLALGLTSAPAVAGAVATLAGTVPLSARAVRRAREASTLSAQWPDFLAIVRSQLAGGDSLPESFVEAGRRSGDVLEQAADRVSELLATGAQFDEALMLLQQELADPMADRVLATLITAHRSGGHRVGAVLAALAASVSDELRLRRAHDAALTQQRLTAAVALVAPWALLVLSVATNPQATAVYRSPTGSLIVFGGLVATVVGYLLALRTARLSRPPRIFE
ncbi:MAG: type II secretion system F family protein [Acidimicrobiia bacterium]